jgi:uncharacterized repeat protein (TIGR03833 family)
MNTNRADIKPGQRVLIVLKTNQQSGKLTEGVVKDILTNASVHPHGIKVRLENGQIGRVKGIKKIPPNNQNSEIGLIIKTLKSD